MQEMVRVKTLGANLLLALKTEENEILRVTRTFQQLFLFYFFSVAFLLLLYEQMLLIITLQIQIITQSEVDVVYVQHFSGVYLHCPFEDLTLRVVHVCNFSAASTGHL